MSNFVSLSTPEKRSQQPDYNVLSQSLKDLNRLPFFKTDKMTMLQEKVKRLSQYCLNLEGIVISSAIKSKIQLENKNVRDYANTVDELSEAKKTTSSEEEKQMLESEIQRIKEALNLEVSEVKVQYNSSIKSVTKEVSNIENIVIMERVQEPLQQEIQRVEEKNKLINEKKTEKDTLLKQRDIIIESQDILRENNIIDQINDYIPSGDDLSELDLSNPEKAVLKEAVEILNKMLDNISEGIKYSQLADAREELNKEIDALDAEIKRLNEDLNESKALLDDLNTVVAAEDCREKILTEVEKYTQNCKIFVAKLDISMGTETDIDDIERLFSAEMSYLKIMMNNRNSVIVT